MSYPFALKTPCQSLQTTVFLRYQELIVNPFKQPPLCFQISLRRFLQTAFLCSQKLSAPIPSNSLSPLSKLSFFRFPQTASLHSQKLSFFRSSKIALLTLSKLSLLIPSNSPSHALKTFSLSILSNNLSHALKTLSLDPKWQSPPSIKLSLPPKRQRPSSVKLSLLIQNGSLLPL